MINNLIFYVVALALITFGSLKPSAAANAVEFPSLLWHNTVSGQNRLWSMSGTTYQSFIDLPTNMDSPGWKMVGIGNLDNDNVKDIIWQHPAFNLLAVWYMNANGSIKSTALLNPYYASPAAWQIVGVADFNGDSIDDIIWEYLGQALHAIWFMSPTQPGTLLTAAAFTPDNPDANWRISCAANSGPSKVPTIVWRHHETGQIYFWYMSGAQMTQSVPFIDSLGAGAQPDLDEQIVGAWDVDGGGQNDLIWHHSTLGVNGVWYLNANTYVSGAYMEYATAPDWFKTEWKLAGQTWNESQWRANFDYGPLPVSATVSISPAQIRLTANAVLQPGEIITIHRRIPPTMDWGIAYATTAGNQYTDENVSIDQTYEYRFGSNLTGRNGTFLKVAITRPSSALENRGLILLLLDSDLMTQYSGTMNAVVEQVRSDLVADGWTTASYATPRHTFINPGYINNLAAIKTYIGLLSGIKGILIVGHVTVPYSGSAPSDNHNGPLEHRGAWPADMYYGSTAGTWTDTDVNYSDSRNPDNYNIPGDGKFDQDAAPAGLQLFVGRVDFANLPSFGTSGSASPQEANLLHGYFTKAHNYRVNGTPFSGLGQRGIAYNVFELDAAPTKTSFFPMPQSTIYENARRACAAIFPNGIGNLDVGDPFFQKTIRSYLWGFLAGVGEVNRISDAKPGFPPLAYLQHTASDIQAGLPGGTEPQIGFYMLLGSWFGDWNVNDNFLRATIAKPIYGLASIYIAGSPVNWALHNLGLGGTLGECMLSTVNNPYYGTEQDRWLSIHGDPTLRLNMIQPPSGLNADLVLGTVNLTWSPGGANRFNIYRATHDYGPFTWVKTVDSTSTSVPDSKQRVYMVRGVTQMTTGCGTYTNLSLGKIVTASTQP